MQLLRHRRCPSDTEAWQVVLSFQQFRAQKILEILVAMVQIKLSGRRFDWNMGLLVPFPRTDLRSTQQSDVCASLMLEL